jgi:hypothetical protein
LGRNFDEQMVKYTAVYGGSPEKRISQLVQELHIPMHPTVESEEIRLESSEITAVHQ